MLICGDALVADWDSDLRCNICETHVRATFPTKTGVPWESDRKWYRDAEGRVWCGKCAEFYERFESMEEAEEYWRGLPDDTDPEEMAADMAEWRRLQRCGVQRRLFE